jgi:hypothetical protein
MLPGYPGWAGLVAGNITSAASNTVAAGVVIGQNPPAGTVVNPGISAALNRVISLGAPLPDLAIAKSHAENFKPGQQNAAYTVTVSNVGTAPVGAGNTVTAFDTPTGVALWLR